MFKTSRGRGQRGGAFRGSSSSRGVSGGRNTFAYGPPQNIIEVGRVLHTCEQELVCECALQEQVPYFNGRIFLHNKEEIGKIDEILGPIHKCMFSVKMCHNLTPCSFKKNTVLFIDSNQVLPLSRFLPKPSVDPPAKRKVGENNKGKRVGNVSFGRGGLTRGRGGFSRGAQKVFRGRSAFRGGRS